MTTRFNSLRVGLPALLSAAAIALIVTGCGGASKPTSATGLPTGWKTVHASSGATLAYPPGWRPIRGDRGTASAALFNADGSIRAYLNATPAQSNERPATWARFRVHHNADEGDRNVRLLASDPSAVLGQQHGACVTDSYQTSRTSYHELACLVTPATGGARTVLVAAAQPRAWASQQRALQFALDHFTN